MRWRGDFLRPSRRALEFNHFLSLAECGGVRFCECVFWHRLQTRMKFVSHGAGWFLGSFVGGMRGFGCAPLARL
jgi:hypothetical protein